MFVVADDVTCNVKKNNLQKHKYVYTHKHLSMCTLTYNLIKYYFVIETAYFIFFIYILNNIFVKQLLFYIKTFYAKTSCHFNCLKHKKQIFSDSPLTQTIFRKK